MLNRGIAALLIALLMTGCKKEVFSKKVDPQSGPWEHPNTVENGLMDTALNCAADSLPANNRHHDTVSAFDYLKNSAETTIVLVGHGAGGSLCTGNGKSCTTSVRFDNLNVWKSEAEKLRPNSTGKTLRILACNLAWGPDGEQLVQLLANRTGRRVLAPVSMVYCLGGAVTLQEPKWFEAQPQQMTVRTTASKSYAFAQAPAYLEIAPGRSSTRVPWPDVVVTDFRILPSFADHDFKPIPKEKWRSLAGQIDFMTPFHPGEPLAIVTGQITLLAGITEKQYLIYADGAVRDKQYPDTFFHVSVAFTNALREQRRRR
jgi:hypothetical protein